jgi:hypothetical protein
MKMGDKKTSSVPVPYVQDDGVSQAGLSSFRELVDNYVDRGGSNDTMIDSLPPFWATSPEPGSLSLIGSFSPYDAESCDQSNISSPPPVSEMFTEKYQNITDECLGLLTCTISAFWEASRDELVLIDGTYLVRAPLAVEASFGRPKYHSPITMTLDGIQAFNNPNFTNLFNRSIGASAPVEPLLAVVFATALSEVPLQENMEYAYSSQPTKNDFSKLEVKTTQYGYGYKSSLNSVRLSLVVMTIYCIITVGYILYLLVTGLTSTAWNSGIELVVLALQSRRPDHLGHTSVGIGSMKTYREGVGIRVNSLDEVELVFAHDRDSSTRGLRQVVPNKSY